MRPINPLRLTDGRSRASFLRRIAASTARGFIPLIAIAPSGCALHGAPSFVLFGAYFPAWMLLAMVAIAAAIAARVVLTSTGYDEVFPMQLLVCTCAGLTFAILVWLLWFAA
jgi:hypothetical protein